MPWAESHGRGGVRHGFRRTIDAASPLGQIRSSALASIPQLSGTLLPSGESDPLSFSTSAPVEVTDARLAAKPKARLRGNDVPIRPLGDRQAVWRPIALTAAAIGAYVVLAVLAYWPVLPLDASKLPHPIGAGAGDPAQMSWFLAWTPFALGHGHNLFFSNYIDSPLGVNLASNTSVPLLGLLSAPVTLAFGPIASFNLLMRIALASSATSMFFVSRRWVNWWAASFAAGLLYGFSSYMTFESSVHLDLAFMPIPPLLFWCLDDLFVTRRRSPVKVGILLGLLSAAQLLIDPELLAACICCGVVAGYPIGYFLAGPRRIPRAIQPAQVIGGFRVDLLRPVLSSSTRLTNPSGYLGIPLLIVLVVIAVWWRRVAMVKFAVACACAAFLISLGPHLTVDGHSLGIWLPEAVFEHIPVLSDLEPVRITAVEMLFLAVLLAVGVDRSRAWILERVRVFNTPAKRPDETRASRLRSRIGSDTRLQTVGLIAVLTVALIPVLDRLPVARERSATAPELTASLARSVPSGDVVLALPYPRALQDEPMLWQAVDEMSFRLVGGYALVPGASGGGRYYLAPSADLTRLSSLLAGPSGASRVASSSACASLETVLGGYHVDALVLRTPLGATRAAGVALLTQLLGPPSVSFGSGDVWLDIPARAPTRSCPERS